MIHIEVTDAAIDPAALLAAALADGAGAVATFVGTVRADDGVNELTLEHYPGATEVALRSIAKDAAERWELERVEIVHRVGTMTPGTPIVFVAAAARHRHAALDAVAFLIDTLKTAAPFWKQERRGGESRWVEPRGSDSAAAARWDQDPVDEP